MISVEEFQATAATWLGRHRHYAPRDYGAICPPELIKPAVDWQRHLYEHGYAGIHWPTEFGGQGLTSAHNAAWQLECAKTGVPAVLNMVGLVLTGGAVQMFGTPEQKVRHLHATLRAEQIWCQLFSEPGAGSDLGSLSTRAERDGDRFIVNGQKVWCSGGRISDWGILMARTDLGAAKHEGISFFLCPMDLAGIEVRPLRQMTGGSEFDEVFFSDVHLPADYLLGPLHGGWNVAMSVLTNERGHIGTAVIGLERRLEQMAAMAKGTDLSPTNVQDLTALYGKGLAYRAMASRQGSSASSSASLLKLGITEMMFEAAVLRTEIVGANAMLTDSSAAEGLLAAPGGRIAGGTSQVQRNIIGERLLGLPREPKV
jgi:alkylation response protein AidB-like acyl-CoA dehydrogenase